MIAPVETILLYLVAGLSAGLLSGLFGMGGGLAVVPMLVLALSLEGIGPVYLMHLAVGTSLTVMVLTSAYTTFLRRRRGDLDTGLLKAFAPPVAAGAIAGSLLGDQLPGIALRVFFILFVVYMMVRLVLRARGAAAAKSPNGVADARTVPGAAVAWGYGTVAGVCGALLGIGVAAVLTPFLIRQGVRIQAASALAAPLAIVVGAAAGGGYIVGGLNELGLPPASLGYVYLPALGGLAAGALVGSPLGIRLSHGLPERAQIAVFLAYLAAVLVVMATR